MVKTTVSLTIDSQVYSLVKSKHPDKVSSIVENLLRDYLQYSEKNVSSVEELMNKEVLSIQKLVFKVDDYSKRLKETGHSDFDKDCYWKAKRKFPVGSFYSNVDAMEHYVILVENSRMI